MTKSWYKLSNSFEYLLHFWYKFEILARPNKALLYMKFRKKYLFIVSLDHKSFNAYLDWNIEVF